jgi:hypothetical protein
MVNHPNRSKAQAEFAEFRQLARASTQIQMAREDVSDGERLGAIAHAEIALRNLQDFISETRAALA